jgi:hypothetical protein
MGEVQVMNKRVFAYARTSKEDRGVQAHLLFHM